MQSVILYIHGKGGHPEEAAAWLENGVTIVGAEYPKDSPWEAAPAIRDAYHQAEQSGRPVVLLANSIGAFFAMHALEGLALERALLISPILDMERLIEDMIDWAGVTEEELQLRGEIPTNFGETLSWRYLSFVREHPIHWDTPTEILYADGDTLTSRGTVERFARRHGAGLTVLRDGEHWFHTEKQVTFLRQWLAQSLKKPAVRFVIDDRALNAENFLQFVMQVWPGNYDLQRTQEALKRTINLTAYHGDTLVGCLRILTDGCFFGTITELLVLPHYQRQGIGSRLLRLAMEVTPTTLYFGAQPQAEGFYEKNGCRHGLTSYTIPAAEQA